MVPVDGSDRIVDSDTPGVECGAVNVGGERVNHDFVIPRVLQGSDAPNGDIETPGESHISVRMATRDVHSAEGPTGDLAGHRFVVGCKRDVGCEATRNSTM